MKAFIKRNGSTILTCTGAVGVVATTITAVKATPKAMEIIKRAEEEKGEKLTNLEKVKVAGPSYIPTILIGAGTVACMFSANVLNKKQRASLMSAYALVDSSYKEFKKKVKEIHGEDGERNIHDEISKDKYKENGITVSEGNTLFYDIYSQRFFESTVTNVLRAEYEINRTLVLDGGVYLNEFYEHLGLEPIESGQELGWSPGILESMYWTSWIDFLHGPVTTEDGQEYFTIMMLQEPVIDFIYY